MFWAFFCIYTASYSVLFVRVVADILRRERRGKPLSFGVALVALLVVPLFGPVGVAMDLYFALKRAAVKFLS
jgi:hypothetical protein